MDIDPGDVLNQARQAFSNKEYETALEKFQWFFDNSIEIKRSYYGVKSSYCLSEWSELANEYSPAKNALLSRKEKALSDFKATSSRQSFHEYSNIAEYLNQPAEAFSQFMLAYKSDKKLAKKLFTFVYEYCAENQIWDICRTYLGNGYEQYLKALEMLDHVMELPKKKEATSESLYILKRLNYLKRNAFGFSTC